MYRKLLGDQHAVLMLIFALKLVLSPVCGADSSSEKNPFRRAEVMLGERLFLETRFSHHFYSFLVRGGYVNNPLDKGDPKLDKTFRFFGLPPYQIPFAAGPFKGKSFNCRTCHMVDEHVDQKELGMRTYADFASRSPLPERDDNQSVTVRNSPGLVSASVKRDNFILHFDGEFSSLEDVVISTLTGRNLGWLPSEYKTAEEHICQVIREDNGEGELAKLFGGFTYAELLLGKQKSGNNINSEYLISEQNRFNPLSTSCSDVIKRIGIMISLYIDDQRFAKDSTNYSPYDIFLSINRLPSQPNAGESDKNYSVRLLALIDSLIEKNNLKFVRSNPNTEDGKFRFHDQPFRFDESELRGLEIFFNTEPTPEKGAGNCGSCHPAPNFTDFSLHNIGVTQIEYEAIHGSGSFEKLYIPSKIAREKQAEIYLPATIINPNRKGVFRQAASEQNPMATDLGAWNIFLNNDFPNTKNILYKIFCQNTGNCESEDQALQNSIATFKTPSLRDLGHSAPYMHNGQISDLHAVIGFYIAASNHNRHGWIRNGDSDLSKIKLNLRDIDPLVKFLISLYEDYH